MANRLSATETKKLQDELAETKKKLAEFEAIATKYIDIADPDDLCDDGKELLGNLKKLTNNLNRPDKKLRFVVELDVNDLDDDFEFPDDFDWTDRSNYDITVDIANHATKSSWDNLHDRNLIDCADPDSVTEVD